MAALGQTNGAGGPPQIPTRDQQPGSWAACGLRGCLSDTLRSLGRTPPLLAYPQLPASCSEIALGTCARGQPVLRGHAAQSSGHSSQGVRCPGKTHPGVISGGFAKGPPCPHSAGLCCGATQPPGHTWHSWVMTLSKIVTLNNNTPPVPNKYKPLLLSTE